MNPLFEDIYPKFAGAKDLAVYYWDSSWWIEWI
jgi:hypothetical protein